MTELTVGLLTGLVALGTAVVTLLVSLNNRRGIQRIEVNVDGRLDQMTARVEQLTHALEGSDTDVPDEPTRPTH